MLKGLKHITLLTLLLVALPGQAHTPDPFAVPTAEPALELAAGAVTLQQAAAKVRKQHGGKVVKAETRTRNGKPVHHIRIVKDGRVKTLIIDAATGNTLQ